MPPKKAQQQSRREEDALLAAAMARASADRNGFVPDLPKEKRFEECREGVLHTPFTGGDPTREIYRLNAVAAKKLRQSVDNVHNLGGNFFLAALDVLFQTLWVGSGADVSAWSRNVPPQLKFNVETMMRKDLMSPS